MKIWYQSTLDFAQHPNCAKALAAHFRKIAGSGTAVLLYDRVGDHRNHLPASEIIGSPVVYQSVVDPAFIRAVLASEEANYSVNLARSFSSAVFARLWQGIWIYFVAPVLGMVTAAGLYTRIVGVGRIYCAKVFHDLYAPCPFDCHFPDLGKPTQR